MWLICLVDDKSNIIPPRFKNYSKNPLTNNNYNYILLTELSQPVNEGKMAYKKKNYELKSLHPDFVQRLDDTLRAKKKQKGITNYVFAMKCGIHPSTLSSILNRAKLFRSDSKIIQRIAEVIGYRGSLFE